MDATRQDWERLGREIEAAREPKFRSRAAFARAAEVDVSTVEAVEKGRPKRGEGQPVSDAMYRKLTALIGWPGDRWEKRLVGLDAPSAEDAEADLLRMVRELRDFAQKIADSADETLKAFSDE